MRMCMCNMCTRVSTGQGVLHAASAAGVDLVPLLYLPLPLPLPLTLTLTRRAAPGEQRGSRPSATGLRPARVRPRPTRP